MPTILGRFSQYFYALLRIVAGLMFMFHGTQKLFAFPGGQGTVAIASMPGIAGIIELVCGLLIAIGLFTSIAAFIASGEMAFAYYLAHWPKSPWPIENGGEPAVLFCVLFLFMVARGPGPISIDRLRKR